MGAYGKHERLTHIFECTETAAVAMGGRATAVWVLGTGFRVLPKRWCVKIWPTENTRDKRRENRRVCRRVPFCSRLIRPWCAATCGAPCHEKERVLEAAYGDLEQQKKFFRVRIARCEQHDTQV